MVDVVVVDKLEVELEHHNQLNIRKLWCDVYASQMKKHGDSQAASCEATKSTMNYTRFFKPEVIKVKAPEGAKE